ncbi:DUF3783 domain-containing protein [Calditerrivibrio sp.]|jgi:molybdenum cofactor biosynthesis enzyme MoaA|uniref:DUF3783 domain-containing protein n=1 Tax=Calditerrivibrio sp. TaxID=2792612 RepID=UPI003D152D6A
MDNKKILVGGFPLNTIDLLKSNVTYEFSVLTSEDVDLVIADILTKESSVGDPLDIKVVLLNGFNREEIFSFIQIYKSLGLPKALFAMITTHSINWKLKDLIYHLIQEEKELKKIN